MKDNQSAFNACDYDVNIEKTLPYYKEFYRQVVDVVSGKFGNERLNWFDIGCGTGRMAEEAFKCFDIEKFVFCDNSLQMIEIAKQRFERDNVEFIINSFIDLDLQEKYKVITAVQVFHYLRKQQREEAIKKCYDNLETGGIFISFDNFAPNSQEGKELFLKRWKLYQLFQGKTEEECDRHLSRYGKEYYPITISEHLLMMEKCGFKNTEVIWVSNMQVGILGIK